MKTILRIVALVMAVSMLFCLTACDANQIDQLNTQDVAMNLAEKQPTPTDIEYSLSRYNLIRRVYYQAGELEKAANLECPVSKPKGYVYLFVEGVGCVRRDTVDGIVTSMQSYLTPDSECYATSGYAAWLADVDGTYGENTEGIFWFDQDGDYHEWSGLYEYSTKYYEINVASEKLESER